MAGYTKNYNLVLPAKTEKYDIETANTNNENIDKILFGKVDKIPSKDLSQNDFTNAYKQKLDTLKNYDDTVVKKDIADMQKEQTAQNTEIENIKKEETLQNKTIEELKQKNTEQENKLTDFFNITTSNKLKFNDFTEQGMNCYFDDEIEIYHMENISTRSGRHIIGFFDTDEDTSYKVKVYDVNGGTHPSFYICNSQLLTGTENVVLTYGSVIIQGVDMNLQPNTRYYIQPYVALGDGNYNFRIKVEKASEYVEEYVYTSKKIANKYLPSYDIDILHKTIEELQQENIEQSKTIETLKEEKAELEKNLDNVLVPRKRKRRIRAFER